mgnify:CR=1 FL=1
MLNTPSSGDDTMIASLGMLLWCSSLLFRDKSKDASSAARTCPLTASHEVIIAKPASSKPILKYNDQCFIFAYIYEHKVFTRCIGETSLSLRIFGRNNERPFSIIRELPITCQRRFLSPASTIVKPTPHFEHTCAAFTTVRYS